MGQIILVAHGSPDPAVGQSVRSAVHRISQAADGARVRAAFLKADVPLLPAALAKEAALAHPDVTVVPMLLTRGRHARQIQDEIVAALRRGLPLRIMLADPLGPSVDAEADHADDLLARALQGRLAASSSRIDAVVVGALRAGSARAMRSVAKVAQGLSTATGLSCRAGFVGDPVQGLGDTIHSLRARGVRHIAVASYLLTQGRWAVRVRGEALRAGAAVVTEPLVGTPELVELVLARAASARQVLPPEERG